MTSFCSVRIYVERPSVRLVRAVAAIGGYLVAANCGPTGMKPAETSLETTQGYGTKIAQTKNATTPVY